MRIRLKKLVGKTNKEKKKYICFSSAENVARELPEVEPFHFLSKVKNEAYKEIHYSAKSYA